MLPADPTVMARWLGVAGLEFGYAGRVLLVDPYLTRIPFWRMWVGHVHPARELLAQHFGQVDDILVTHAHFDHLLDVPVIAQRSQAQVAASPNACCLLEVSGVPAGQRRTLHAGDRLDLGPFQVDVRRARHGLAPGFGAGELPPHLQAPLRARDYRMDMDFSFLIHVAGLSILTDPGEDWQDATRADVLFISPARPAVYYERVLPQVQARLVMPLHWDNLFRPLSAPLTPYYGLPHWAWPPLQRINLADFKRRVQEIWPAAQVLVPELLRPFDLSPMPA
jgi:L-ascorbate metabolism protein UlaG (beta-lactamase superfamily)